MKDSVNIPSNIRLDLERYAKKFGYDWLEVYDGINYRVSVGGLTLSEAVEEVKEQMTQNKSLYDSLISDDNEPLKQKVVATLERTGLRSAVNAIYGKYPSKIGLDIDPSKSTEIVSALKKDFSKVVYNSDAFEVVIGDALGFTSVEVPKKVVEELMLGWDIDRLCRDFHLNVTKQSSSYYFVGESSWIDKFYKAYGLDQFGIKVRDSVSVSDGYELPTKGEIFVYKLSYGNMNVEYDGKEYILDGHILVGKEDLLKMLGELNGKLIKKAVADSVSVGDDYPEHVLKTARQEKRRVSHFTVDGKDFEVWGDVINRCTWAESGGVLKKLSSSGYISNELTVRKEIARAFGLSTFKGTKLDSVDVDDADDLWAVGFAGDDEKVIQTILVRAGSEKEAADKCREYLKRYYKKVGIYGARKHTGSVKPGMPIIDSATVSDARIEYVFNWRDTYHKTQQKTAILANNIGEAIRKFADYVALAGVGTANAYVMSISPNDGWVALYGTAHELKKKMGDSMPVADKLAEIPQAILNRIESIAASRGYKVTAKGKTLFGREHYEFVPLNPVTDSQMRAFVDEVDSYARSKNVPATFSANVVKVVFDFDKIYVKDSAVADEVSYDTLLANWGFAFIKGNGRTETWYYRDDDDEAFRRALRNIREVRPSLIASSTNDGTRQITIVKDSKKMFKVTDKSGKVYLVKANDEMSALSRLADVKAVKDYSPEVRGFISKLEALGLRFERDLGEDVIRFANPRRVSIDIVRKNIPSDSTAFERDGYVVVNF